MLSKKHNYGRSLATSDHFFIHRILYYYFRSDNNGEIVFEPGCIQPDPTNELLEEMKSFSVTDSSDAAKQKSEY